MLVNKPWQAAYQPLHPIAISRYHIIFLIRITHDMSKRTIAPLQSAITQWACYLRAFCDRHVVKHILIHFIHPKKDIDQIRNEQAVHCSRDR